MTISAGKVLERARLEALEKAPYQVSSIMALAPYETTKIPTFAVSPGGVMFYNPEYTLKLYAMKDGVLKVATRIWHEDHHLLRETHLRLQDIDAERRNICADLAINSSGVPGGWDFGPDGLLPSKYKLPDGLTAEEYHRKLPLYPPPPEWGGACGTGGGGKPLPKELEEVAAQHDRSALEMDSIRTQVAMDVKRRIEQGMQPGTLPGGMAEWATALLQPPVVPWTTTYSRLVKYCTGMLIPGGGIDTSYERPAARTFHVPVPDVIKPIEMGQQAEVCIILDTSGSMSLEGEIRPALRESIGAMAAINLESVWLLQVDADLGCKPKRVSIKDLMKLEVHGRGGTDFRPGFEAALKLRPRPDLIIYMTDGWGPAPEKPPRGVVTLWLLVGKHANKDPAPWGHKVRVPK